MTLTPPCSGAVSTADLERRLEHGDLPSCFHRTDDGLLCCRTCGVCHEPEVVMTTSPDAPQPGATGTVAMLECPCCHERASVRVGQPAP